MATSASTSSSERPAARIALICLAAVATSAALWVSRGALTLSEAGAGAVRMGLLPEPWAPIRAGIVIAAVALWRRAPLSRILLLLALATLLLPWLPCQVPAVLLAWTGPLATWIWAGVLVAMVLAAWPERDGRLRSPAWVREPARAPIVALAASFVVACATAWQISPVLPAGDEPHYLVIAQSLLEDGDLQIENNHDRGDYQAYFQGRLRPDYLRRGRNGQIYSVHAPGLPALVAPAFAVGGYPAVVVFLAIVAALGAALLWRTAFRLTGSAAAAWFGWASVWLTTPFLFNAVSVYPDATGAVLVLTGVAGLVDLEVDARRERDPSTSTACVRWILQGTALAVLPWLHTRYAGAAAVLGFCLALRLIARGRIRELLAFAVVPVASAVAWFGFFQAVYGTFSPAAPYGHYTQSKLANVPRALPALLLDQQFGVIPNAPVYAIALVGLVALWREHRRLALELGGLAFSYLAAVAAYHMWWGGWSAPARFTVPTLLVLGLPAAANWARCRTAGRATALAALVVSLLITATIALTDNGRLLFNDRTEGAARWTDRVSPIANLPGALPGFLRDSPMAALAQAGIWAGALIAAACVLTWITRGRASRGRPSRGGIGLACLVLFPLAAMVAATLSWSVTGAAPLRAGPSQLALLRGFDPVATPVGVQIFPLQRLAPADVAARLRLSGLPRRAAGEDPLLVVGDLAPGLYQLLPDDAPRARGRLSVIVGRSATPVERWELTPAGQARDLTVDLPVGVNALTILGDDEARRSISSLTLRPLRVIPISDRVTADRARRAARYGAATVFSFDDQAFLEEPGFWVRGQADVRVVVRADDQRRVVQLLVRNGPKENRATLRSGVWEATLPLAPRAERAVDVPLDLRFRAVMLEIRAEQGFRPVEVEAGNPDARYLGVWVEILPR